MVHNIEASRNNEVIEITEIIRQDLNESKIKSVIIIIDNGVMKLSYQQGVYLYEFDGPKIRNNVKIIQG